MPINYNRCNGNDPINLKNLKYEPTKKDIKNLNT
jgi:hypothetical protein